MNVERDGDAGSGADVARDAGNFFDRIFTVSDDQAAQQDFSGQIKAW
jgi:hypothetical protein